MPSGAARDAEQEFTDDPLAARAVDFLAQIIVVQTARAAAAL
jgi:hypothetical protein